MLQTAPNGRIVDSLASKCAALAALMPDARQPYPFVHVAEQRRFWEKVPVSNEFPSVLMSGRCATGFRPGLLSEEKRIGDRLQAVPRMPR